jgi:predicted carbohydrate-binding protein with CBM5 and CBM33 domain
MRALLAQCDQETLVYAGAAFIALSVEEGTTCGPGSKPHHVLRQSGARWVKPEIKARVRHLAGSSSIRHGTVRGIV